MSNERTAEPPKKFSIRLDKYEHTYLIRYRADQTAQAICQLGFWADDPQFNFDWHDAECLRRMIQRRANCRTGEILD